MDQPISLVPEKWLTAPEAAAILQSSSRTVQKFAKDGVLKWKPAGRKSHPNARLYDPEDVQRLAAEFKPKPNPASGPKRSHHRQTHAPPAPRLFLTLEQASLYAGLTVEFLESLIAEGKLFALRGGVGGDWVISRASLDSFAGRRRFR